MEHLQVPNQSPEIWAESCQLYSFNQSMFYMYIVCIVALFAMLNNCICFFRFIHWHLLDSLSMSGLSMGNRIKWFWSFVFFVFLLGIPKMAVTHNHYIVSTVFLCVPIRIEWTILWMIVGFPNLGNAHVRTNPRNIVVFWSFLVYVYPLVMSK